MEKDKKQQKKELIEKAKNNKKVIIQDIRIGINAWRIEIIGSIIILILVIPLAIHTLFKISAPNEFFVANWTAGDVLTFYGAVLAAAGTVFAVWLTIKTSIYNQEIFLREENKRQLIILRAESERERINKWIDEVKEIFKDIGNLFNLGMLKKEEMKIIIYGSESYINNTFSFDLNVQFMTIATKMMLLFKSTPLNAENILNDIKMKILDIFYNLIKEYIQLADTALALRNKKSTKQYNDNELDLEIDINLKNLLDFQDEKCYNFINDLGVQIKKIEKIACDEIVNIMK